MFFILLVDDGKVSLDRLVTDYLTEFRMADNRCKAITVRMTLNHTPGLPGTQGANSFGSIYYDNVKRETIDTLSRSHLKHAPGAMAAAGAPWVSTLCFFEAGAFGSISALDR